MRKYKTFILLLLIILGSFIYNKRNSNEEEIAYGISFINDSENGKNNEDNNEVVSNGNTNNASFSLTCPEIAMESSEFICNLYLKNINGKVLGVSLEYNYNKDLLSYISYDNNKTFTLGDGDKATSSGLTMTFNEGISGDVSLGTIKFRVTSNSEVSQKNNISIKAKVVYEGDTDNYQELEEKKASIMINKLTNVLNYIKVGDESLTLIDDIYKYNVIVENNITSIKIDSVLSNIGINMEYDTENGNRVVKDLKVGDNINNIILKSNGIEVVKIAININRKDANGKVIGEANQIITNPKTGGLSPLIVFILLLFMIGTIILMKKKLMKEEH